MRHDLTLGHLDPGAVTERRRVVVKPLEMDLVHGLLEELGGTDAEGNPTLGGARVRFEQGYIVVPWLGGGTNRVSEEFALRLHKATGCLIADVGHSWVVPPERLQGLSGAASAAIESPAASGRETPRRHGSRSEFSSAHER
ncbi:MAG TPA: hypothetical protein VFF52_07595 [Isosphaeraceae bacterium]|nr:hypothetical protein [Isosphaeraceae bacterium]